MSQAKKPKKVSRYTTLPSTSSVSMAEAAATEEAAVEAAGDAMIAGTATATISWVVAASMNAGTAVSVELSLAAAVSWAAAAAAELSLVVTSAFSCTEPRSISSADLLFDEIFPILPVDIVKRKGGLLELKCK